MKKLLIIAAVCVFAACLWKHQSGLLREVLIQNKQLADVATELKERAERADTARLDAEGQLGTLRGEMAARRAAASNLAAHDAAPEVATIVEPDPQHHGGWPQDATYFYLPKQYLTNVSYHLLNGGQLTDEAAALLGMSTAERESTDKAFADLTDQFHSTEIKHMEQVDPPDGWVTAGNSSAPSAVNFTSVLTYHIPDLTDDMNSAQNAFLDQLQQTLGVSRAQIIGSAADSFVRQNMSDLGAGDRTVGFAWNTESDGTQSLWYAVADPRNGEGAFQRVDANLDPNSQIAYYARLFGVKLPAQ